MLRAQQDRSLLAEGPVAIQHRQVRGGRKEPPDHAANLAVVGTAEVPRPCPRGSQVPDTVEFVSGAHSQTEDAMARAAVGRGQRRPARNDE